MPRGEGGPVNYLYDGKNILEELDISGNVVARYSSRQETDQPLAELRAGTASYYQTDALGSVRSLSSSVGAVADTYTYDSFGKLTASTGTLANPFQFTGRDFDAETGLFYYRARYYDQNAGRFISEDPLGTDGGPNSYRYLGTLQRITLIHRSIRTGEMLSVVSKWTQRLPGSAKSGSEPGAPGGCSERERTRHPSSIDSMVHESRPDGGYCRQHVSPTQPRGTRLKEAARNPRGPPPVAPQPN